MADTEKTVVALRAMADSMRENREYLTQLDAAIGDADHGTNMNRGFEAALEKLDEPASPQDALKAVSTALIGKVGGSAGPLYGTAFLRAAPELGDEVSAASLAAALEAALAGVKQRGKAEPGEKTMIDALEPAARAARETADSGGGVADALRAAADAAREGAESTAPMTATKGRASYLGERSVGHVDPGASSTQLLLEAAARSLEESQEA